MSTEPDVNTYFDYLDIDCLSNILFNLNADTILLLDELFGIINNEELYKSIITHKYFQYQPSDEVLLGRERMFKNMNKEKFFDIISFLELCPF